MWHAREYITHALVSGKQCRRVTEKWVVAGLSTNCWNGCNGGLALKVCLIMLKRVRPSVTRELTDVNCDMAFGKEDHITDFMSESLPSDCFFCGVQDHAKALADSAGQTERRIGTSWRVLDDINFNKVRNTLNGDGYLGLAKQMRGICGII